MCALSLDSRSSKVRLGTGSSSRSSSAPARLERAPLRFPFTTQRCTLQWRAPRGAGSSQQQHHHQHHQQQHLQHHQQRPLPQVAWRRPWGTFLRAQPLKRRQAWGAPPPPAPFQRPPPPWTAAPCTPPCTPGESMWTAGPPPLCPIPGLGGAPAVAPPPQGASPQGCAARAPQKGLGCPPGLLVTWSRRGIPWPPRPPPPPPSAKKQAKGAAPAPAPAPAAAAAAAGNTFGQTGAPLFILDVDVGGSRKESIVITREGTPEAIAAAFVKHHGLPAGVEGRLTQLIKRTKESFVASGSG